MFAIKPPAVALALLALATTQSFGQGLPVDLELVLAVDVSGSMDDVEHAVQRTGYVEALRHPDVVGVVLSGAHGRIALTYVEWAGPTSQVTVVPWRLIDSAERAAAVADELAARPISFIRGTSISGALEYALGLFADNRYDGSRRVIDVSGDGPNNGGTAVVVARAAALADGVIINGLPIMIRPSGSFVPLDRYYADCVVGGPGSFVLPVDSPGQLAEAIRRKLILEIAGPSVIGPTPVQFTVPGYC